MRGRQQAERAGAGGEAIELAEALEQRRGEAVDRGIVLQVERDQRGFAAEFADIVVEFFQRRAGLFGE